MMFLFLLLLSERTSGVSPVIFVMQLVTRDIRIAVGAIIMIVIMSTTSLNIFSSALQKIQNISRPGSFEKKLYNCPNQRSVWSGRGGGEGVKNLLGGGIKKLVARHLKYRKCP